MALLAQAEQVAATAGVPLDAYLDLVRATVENVAALGPRVGALSFVTHCYERPRHPPHWPYNLFCMVHAKSRDEAYAVIDDVNLQADMGLYRQTVLFSTRCFKQRGAVFSNDGGTN